MPEEAAEKEEEAEKRRKKRRKINHPIKKIIKEKRVIINGSNGRI